MRGDWKIVVLLTLAFLAFLFPVWYGPYVWQTLYEKREVIGSILVAISVSVLGAIGGVYLTEQRQYQKILVEEFRNTNAAIMIVFGIFNSLINLKRQFALPFREAFYEAKADLEIFVAERAAGIQKPFSYQANLATMQQSRYSIEPLERILFEKISLIGRPITLLSILSNTLHSLNDTIRDRNIFIDKIRVLKESGIPEVEIAELYFGTPLVKTSVDMSYTNSIDNIFSTTNDALFFSKLLCEDLVKHSRQIREKVSGHNKRIYEPDFTSVDKNLLPDEEHYSNWVNNFK